MTYMQVQMRTTEKYSRNVDVSRHTVRNYKLPQLGNNDKLGMLLFICVALSTEAHILYIQYIFINIICI